MELDEAIRHCEEVAAEKEDNARWKLTSTWQDECKQCAADHRQLVGWLKELKELRCKVFADDPLIETTIEMLDTELREAKRLLKLAVEDNKCVLTENFGDICIFCKHGSNSDAQCRKPHNGSGSWCCDNAEWRYADEAEKLLGGNENG